MWALVPIVLAKVVSLGGNAIAGNAFIAGDLLQALQLLAEVGDGEFFRLPGSTDMPKYLEEVFELLLRPAACTALRCAFRWQTVA